MNVVQIDKNNFDDEYKASADAIRDFPYMFFEIAGDRRPVGDFDRAELGEVNPFRYLDIKYDYEYQFLPIRKSNFYITGRRSACCVVWPMLTTPTNVRDQLSCQISTTK